MGKDLTSAGVPWSELPEFARHHVEWIDGRHGSSLPERNYQDGYCPRTSFYRNANRHPKIGSNAKPVVFDLDQILFLNVLSLMIGPGHFAWVIRPGWLKARSELMRTYFTCVALGFSLAAGAPVANAQSSITQPYEAFITQPSGTLVGSMPLIAVSAGVLQPVQTVQTVQTVRVARSAVRHRIVAIHHTTVHHVAAATSSRPLYNYVAPVQRVVVPVVITQAPGTAPGQVLNLSGQFQCVAGCAGGQPGLVLVTQNGWNLNLVNELGQPTQAWVDWPGHIWAQSWNEGAVYSPDGMTIQFDNGTVWRRNIELLVLPSAPLTGR